MSASSGFDRAAKLDKLATESGQFAILALDHLRSFATTVRPDAPDTLTLAEMELMKQGLIDGLAASASAVLIDPGLAMGRLNSQASALPVGMILGIEDGDYEAAEVPPRLLPGWTVERAANLGADGVKISFYFDPDGDTRPAVSFVEETVRQCGISGLPLFCEPLVRIDDAADSRRKVMDGVRRFGSLGADVLKIQFPCDTDGAGMQEEWIDACSEADEMSASPWALLSEGRDYEVFRELLTVACQAGCSGFLGGRAIWGGATDTSMTSYADRLAELRLISTSEGKPWRNHGMTPLTDVTHQINH